jgi:hypothetical protein
MNYKDLLESKEKRYVVTFEMWMWDKDDKSVIKQADKLCKQLDAKFAGDCTVQGIIEQEFGTSTNRKIK